MNENVMLLKRHPRSVFFWHLWFVAGAGLAVWLLVHLFSADRIDREAIAIGVAILLIVLKSWSWTIRWLLGHEWRITEACIEAEHEPWGPFRWMWSTSVTSIPLHRIRMIKLIKDPTDHWLGMKGCGRLLIDVLGDASGELVIPDIPDVANVKTQIERRLPRHYN